MKFPTLDAWLDWQAGLNPNEIELGLERVRQVWDRLGPPQLPFVRVSVAGTNGKGSSVAMLESILRSAGYRTGSYTSPHLLRYNERIRIDAVPATDGQICQAFERIELYRGEVPLTYFEYGTLAALLLLDQAAVDVAILEVGLGGRLDAVNLIDADVALITSIGLDHQDWLGEDRESIAREKAGILRPGRPAVFSGQEMPASITGRAEELASPLFVLDRDFHALQENGGWSWKGPDQLRSALPLPALRGQHQLHNAAGVLMVLELLQERLPVDQQAVRNGLLTVKLPGRMEVWPGEVTWVLDVAHNPQAVQRLRDNLENIAVDGETIAVLGMLNDKDVAGVLGILGDQVDRWHMASLGQPRGLNARELSAAIPRAGVKKPVMQHPSVAAALEEVDRRASAGDLVLVFGSFHTVGEAMEWRSR